MAQRLDNLRLRWRGTQLYGRRVETAQTSFGRFAVNAPVLHGSLNRDRILAIALDALAADPNASMHSIAKAAGVGQGTLFRHFLTRVALLPGRVPRRDRRFN